MAKKGTLPDARIEQLNSDMEKLRSMIGTINKDVEKGRLKPTEAQRGSIEAMAKKGRKALKKSMRSLTSSSAG